MGMLKIIELHAFDDETLVQKFDMKDNVIKKRVFAYRARKSSGCILRQR